MNVENLISILERKEINISLSGDQLRVQASKGAITPDIAEFIRENKLRLIEVLKNKLNTNTLSIVDRNVPHPLSFSQQRYWFLNELNRSEGVSPYSIPLVLKVKGGINFEAISKAANYLIQRHPILRTLYKIIEGEVRQVVKEVVSYTVERITIAKENDLNSFIHQFRSHHFDLENEYPFKMAVLRGDCENDYFLFVVHHIAFDGVSQQIFQKELLYVYEHYLNDCLGQPELKANVFQYLDYAVWQRAHSDNYEEGKGYWVKRLDGVGTLQLPKDVNIDNQNSQNTGSLKSIKLRSELKKKLEILAKSESASLFTILFTGLSIVLSRWSGAQDFIIGTVNGGRDKSEIENLIGCFVNFLPLRCKLDESRSILDQLRKNIEEVYQDFNFQYYPFDLIRENIDTKIEDGKNPLFKVALLYQNFDINSEKTYTSNLLQSEISVVKCKHETALLDLRFVVVSKGEELDIQCEFDKNLFQDVTIDHLLYYLKGVLSAIAEDPNMTLGKIQLPKSLQAQASNIPTTNALEIQQHEVAKECDDSKIWIASNFTLDPLLPIIEFWRNRTEINIVPVFAPYDQVCQQLLNPSCSIFKENYEAIYILLSMEKWVNGRVSQPKEECFSLINDFLDAMRYFASRTNININVILTDDGNKQTSDAVLTESLEYIVGMLAELRLSFPDINYFESKDVEQVYPVAEKDDRIAKSIADIPYTNHYYIALGSFIFRYQVSLQSKPFKVIVLDCDNTLWGGVCAEVGAKNVDLSEPWIYLQKEVLKQEQNGVLLCLCSKNNQEDVIRVFNSNSNLLLKLSNIVSHRINWQPKSNNIKSLANEMNLGLDSFIFIDDDPYQCAEVRENCPQVTTLHFPNKIDEIKCFVEGVWPFDKARFGNLTSKSRTESYRQNKARILVRNESISLQNFIESLKLKLRFLPLSEKYFSRATELMIRVNQFNLSGLALKEKELREKVSNNSIDGFLVEANDKFGDYGLVGLCIYKLRNESLEVENFLLSCRSLARGIEYESFKRIGSIALNHNCKKVLVPFIDNGRNVPTKIFLDSLIATASVVDKEMQYVFEPSYLSTIDFKDIVQDGVAEGEINTSSTIEHKSVVSDYEFIASKLNSVEAINNAIGTSTDSKKGPRLLPGDTSEVANLWCEVLGKEENTIKDDDNFFSLGGSSLKGVMVLSAVYKRFNKELTLKELFENPVLRDFTKLCVDEARGKSTEIVVPRLQQGVTVPLSHNQERIWLIEKMGAYKDNYVISLSYKITGELDLLVLGQAIKYLISRHDALRIEIVEKGGVPYQKVLDHVDWEVRNHQIVNAGSEELIISELNLIQQKALSRWVYPNNKNMFNVDVAQIISDGQTESVNVLMINMHHIISDEWSIGTFVSELFHVYSAFSKSINPNLNDMDYGFCDIVAWQKSNANEKGKNIDFWRKKLFKANATLNLPYDKGYQRNLNERALSCFTFGKIPKSLKEKARVFCADRNLTQFIWMLTGFYVLLSKYTGKSDIVVGVPVSGRDKIVNDSIIGFFINSLLLRIRSNQDDTIEKLLLFVKDEFYDAIEHQNIALADLIETFKINNRDNHRSGLFDVNVAFNMIGEKRYGDAQLLAEELEIDEIFLKSFTEKKSERDLTLQVHSTESDIKFHFEYDASKFTKEFVDQLSEHYLNALESIIDQCDSKIKNVGVVDNNQIGQLLGLDNQFGDTLYPVSTVQRDILFDALLKKGLPEYNIGLSYKLRSEVDIDLWFKAIEHVTNCCSVMRTRIKQTDKSYLDLFYQYVIDRDKPDIQYIDLSGQCFDEEELEKKIRDCLYQPIIPLDSPLIKHFLIRFEKNSFIYIMSVHHVIFDGVSLELAWKKISNTYYSLLEENKAPIIDDNTKYFEYTLLDQVESEHDVYAYWKSQYEEVEPLKFAGVVQGHTYSNAGKKNNVIFEDTEKLEELHWKQILLFCKENKITPAIYFKCVFSLLVSISCRVNGKYIIYEIVSSRSAKTMDSLGCFIRKKPLVFKSALHRFSEVLTNYKTFHKESRKYENVSMATQSKLDPSEDLYFVFTYKNFESGESVDDEAYEGRGYSGESNSVIDFCVTTYLNNKVPKLDIKYSKKLFEDEKFLRRLIVVSKQIVEERLDNLSSISVIVPDELEDQLVNWNATKTKYNLDVCVHDRFRSSSLKYPERVAVIHNDETISYQFLDKLSNKIAREICDVGVKRNEFVGVYLTRSINFVASVLGIMKSGAAYVPFDASYPDDRIRYMIEDSGVKLIISVESLLNQFKDESVSWLLLDKDFEKISCQSESDFDSGCRKSDNIYMLYTSGSTGKPKAALIRHEGALNHILAEYDHLELEGKVNILQVAPTSSDMSVWQFLAPLVYGSYSVIIDEVANPNLIISSVIRYEINVVELVPTVLILMMDHLENHGYDKNSLDSLKAVMVTGESVSAAIVDRWITLFPEIPIVNAYGPTEASDDVIQARITKKLPKHSVYTPIGKPINNMNAYIVGPYLNLLPTGIAGEICVSGVGVGAGYWNNKDKTNENFVENPFPGMLGDTLYKTGDLGRWLPDGNIECLGRIDRQINIRGHRIETSEIESQLLKLEYVKNAAVKHFKLKGLGDLLVGYVETVERIPLDNNVIKKDLSRWFPDYMIPGVFVEMTNLPTNGVGKVDYDKLSQPGSINSLTNDYKEPVNEIQKNLVRIWADILGITESEIGIQDNFFELGGQSLLAARLVVGIEKQLKKSIQLADIFLNPTIEQQEKNISDILEANVKNEIDKLRIGEVLPLSYTQLEYWFMYCFLNNPWTINDSFYLEGDIDVVLLRESLEKALNSHEIFHMSYSKWKPVQEYGGTVNGNMLVTVDLSRSDKLKRSTVLTEFMNKEVNISSSPNCEFLLIKEGQRKYIFCSKFSHITVDAYAQSLFIETFLSIYNSNYNSADNKLPNNQSQITDYIEKERNEYSESNINKERKFWEYYLHDAHKLEMSKDQILGHAHDDTTTGEFPEWFTSTLNYLEKEFEFPSLVVFVTMFSEAVSSELHQDEFCVKYFSENRLWSQSLNLVAPMMVEGVLRYENQLNKSVKDKLIYMREQYLMVLTHNKLPWIIPMAILERNYASHVQKLLSPVLKGLSHLVAKTVFRNAKLYPDLFYDYFSFLNVMKARSRKKALDVTVNMITNINATNFTRLGNDELKVERIVSKSKNRAINSEAESLNLVINRSENECFRYSIFGGGLKAGVYKEIERRMLDIAKSYRVVMEDDGIRKVT